MRGVVRILLILFIATALPLRGYAAVAADLCAGHHGGTPSEQGHDHDHESTDVQAGPGAEHSPSPTCSHCVSCSVGASLASDSVRKVNALISGTDRIPFFDARKSGYVPEQPDRPPLALSGI